MSYLLKFGSYSLPNTLYPANDPTARSIGGAKIARADGARLNTGYLDRAALGVRGTLIKGPTDTSDLRTRLDALRAALAAGPASLYYGEDDRYYRNAQCSSAVISYDPTGFSRIATVEIEFVAGDPFRYATSETTDTWAIAGTPASKTITLALGNAYAQPRIEVTVGGVGAITLAATVTNTTTGEAFTLTGTVAGGDVIVVDTLAQTVVIGATDRMDLFDGQFPRLGRGDNAFTASYTSGTITQIETIYRARWW